MLSSTGLGPSMGSSQGQGGKKAKTILTPHLDIITHGSLLIVLDNNRSSHPVNEPISGKIMVNLSQPFDVNAVTLSLCGFQRSFFKQNPGIGMPAQAA